MDKRKTIEKLMDDFFVRECHPSMKGIDKDDE